MLSVSMEPITLPKVGDLVADRLLVAIAVGEVLPGDQLPGERQMADAMGVNRPSVREALRRLAGVGCVDVRHGRGGGAFARRPSPEEAEIARALLAGRRDPHEALDTMRLVEGLIARTAAERRTDTDIAVLEQTLQAVADAVDDAERARAGRALHAALGAATGNPTLVRCARRIRARAVLTLWSRGLPGPDHPGADVVAAVTSGEPDEAAAAVIEQFRHLEETHGHR